MSWLLALLPVAGIRYQLLAETPVTSAIASS